MTDVRRTDRWTIAAWGLWDWGSAAFNAVLITFIFSVYLTGPVGDNIDGPFTPAQYYGFAIGLAGVAIAAITPIMGQRADVRGTRRRSVGLWTFVTVALMAALFFIRDDGAIYFWVGIAIMAVASVTFQFAEVNYFAQLRQISTPETVGRVSGFGWSMGYFGGIVLLLLCFLGFVSGEGDTLGLLGLPAEGGLNIRLVAVFAAVWFGAFALPLLLRIPEIAPSGEKQTGIVDSYRRLFSDVALLWRTDRNAVFFLLSSAIFRDGLSGVFAFGAIIAVSVYGLSPSDVLLFGVAANVAAALGSVAGGFLDDRIGPKLVIMISLALMIATSMSLLFIDGPQGFWFFGLVLCMFVGPAQSAARSFLTRVSPPGRDGQMFGLYATTGRAVSWLSPIMFSLFVTIGGGGDRTGILGIALVLLVGALLLLPVKDPSRSK
ncbi:MFS transporter [Corynebacterium alimapuense]|uniref:MFS transporter n=1 Tax=Corynebacterium alimapuense TaxID=1576874 RepID=A0A3M8KBD4_9CORY|nr:MFS transporter [Corynebacterium alimapuense]RNE49854.1 MFS transporter [Corynebacterium alimapuense]